MSTTNLRSLLDRISAVRSACDLDLLLFFHRHPCALLPSEQIVAYLGYAREQVAASLEKLIEAGLLKRSQNPAEAAQLYRLGSRDAPGGLLASLLEAAATRQGRLELMRLLEREPDRAPSVSLVRAAGIADVA